MRSGPAVWNTLFLGSITLAIEFVIAMALAAFVYRSNWAQSWRIIFMLPMLFMPSAVSYFGNCCSTTAA